MDAALTVLYVLSTLALLVAIAGLTYLRRLLGNSLGLLEQQVEAEKEALVGELEQRIPQFRALVEQAESTAMKATRAVRTWKQKTEQKPDDDDLLHALDHPIAKGLLRGLEIDVEALQRGDPEQMQRLQDLASGGQGQQKNGGFII